MKGKGLTLTGQLGDVMKESAQTAVGYIRSKALSFGISEDAFEENEGNSYSSSGGAIPKDGPSAGITLATTLVSLLTEKAIKKSVAMTGEITLTGKVLPVGGIKEKALAAMRRKIDTVIIPWKNQKIWLIFLTNTERKSILFQSKPLKKFLKLPSKDGKPRQKKERQNQKEN